MRIPRRAAAALGAGLSAILLTLAAVVPAQAAGTGWIVVFTHHYGPAKNFSGYFTVIAPGRNDAWAFGGTNLSGATSGAPVAVHWNGTAWRASALPGGLTDAIFAAGADSPSDIWAVASLAGYILHWNGTAWTVAKQLPGTGQLTGVTAFSPTNVWVFGSPGAFNGLGTWHFDGSTWTKQTGNAAGLDKASALSPTDIWAIGGVAAPQDAIMHYNGTTWTQVTASGLAGLQFNDIMAVAQNDVWLLASTRSAHLGGTLVHLVGSTTTSFPIPFAVDPESFAPDGHGGFWLSAIDAKGQTWAVHRSASGAWSRILIGAAAQMFEVARIPGTSSLWGAGFGLTVPAGSNAAIWAHGTP
jgi:hypothetical protein